MMRWSGYITHYDAHRDILCLDETEDYLPWIIPNYICMNLCCARFVHNTYCSIDL